MRGKKKASSRKGAHLGQHFLTGRWAAKKLAEAADIKEGNTVLEIGPGKGALTKELLARGAHVIAVEKDPALVEYLRDVFANDIARSRLALAEQDVRDFNPADYKLQATNYALAANIPYYITGEILRMFLTAREQPRTMALLVQKEVAERILARDGKESLLSISVKAFGRPEIAAKVSRGNFSPPPSVDSAILVIKNISREFFETVDEKKFFEVLRTGFSSKRKLLLGNLAKRYGRKRVENAFAACAIPPLARAEDILLEKWGYLVKHLC